MAEKLAGDETSGGGSGGMSRREMIRNAAIAGGLAWTAPIIVESMMNPAYAVGSNCACTTGTLKRSNYAIAQGPTATCQTGATQPPSTCEPTCYASAGSDTCTAIPFTVGVAQDGNSSNETVTMTMSATGTLFVGGEAYSGTTCLAAGTVGTSSGKSTLSFIKLSAPFSISVVYCS